MIRPRRLFPPAHPAELEIADDRLGHRSRLAVASVQVVPGRPSVQQSAIALDRIADHLQKIVARQIHRGMLKGERIENKGDDDDPGSAHLLILDPDSYDAWMDVSRPPALELLRPYPADEMTAYRVGLAVGNKDNDGLELIAPHSEP